MKQALRDYIFKYFDFKSRTSRFNYWWAICTVFCTTVILSIVTVALRLSVLMPFWLGFNIIPLFSLTYRRLRDVGFNNKGLILGTIVYFGLFGLFILDGTSRPVAFCLELLSIIIVLLPLLKSDELLDKTGALSFLLRSKYAKK